LYLCQLKGLKNKLNKGFQIRNCKMGGGGSPMHCTWLT
jgi:hypothetical protein